MTTEQEKYFVVGGLYKDTSFTEMADGEKLARLGPFDDYDQAVAVWRAKAMETVDEAYAKFNIEKIDHQKFWVVGGEYTDTDFKTLKNSNAEDKVGPFDTVEEAREAWKNKSMANIDNCYVRYRIDKL